MSDHAAHDPPPPTETVVGRVQWIDTDAAGIYHFTNAFRWLEAAEASFFRRRGLLDHWHGLVRRRITIEFERSLRFDDEYEASITPVKVGRSSITWSFAVRTVGEICVQGELVCVNVDDTGAPTPLPENVRRALEEALAPSS